MYPKKKFDTYHYFDERGNIYLNALSESIWALNLIDNLSEEDQKIYKTLILSHDKDHHIHQPFVPTMESPMKDWLYYRCQDESGAGRKAQMELNWEFNSGETGSFSQEEALIHQQLRESDIYAEATRGRRKTLKRTPSVRDLDAGLVSRRYPSPEPIEHNKLKDYFPKPVYHEKGSSIRKEVIGGLDEDLKKTGAPFIAGTSGTIEYEIFDLRRSVLKGIIREKDIEKWIIIAAADLILGGHHGLAEILIVAQEKVFGYFADLADPRKNYAAFIQGLSLACKKYELFSEFTSLSEAHAAGLLQKGLRNIKNQAQFKGEGFFKEQGNGTFSDFLEKIEDISLKFEKTCSLETIVSALEQLQKEYKTNKKLLNLFEPMQPYLAYAKDLICLLQEDGQQEERHRQVFKVG